MMSAMELIKFLAICIAVIGTGEGLVLSPRIIGGRPIFDRCQAPFNSIVALQFPAENDPVTFCSAVMITNTYLVTTASCLLTMARLQTPQRKPVAVVGERDTIMRNEKDEQRIGIRSFKVHFSFNKTGGAIPADNIGLIQLDQPARMSPCVKLAPRMEKDPNACEDVDESCIMVGWGSFRVSDPPRNSRLPRSAPVTVYSDVITTLLSSNQDEIPPIGSLYAESKNSWQKACYFDWGGLVSCMRNRNYVLRGIIADHNCNSQGNYPIVITNTEFYQTWLDRCTENWDTCPSASSQ